MSMDNRIETKAPPQLGCHSDLDRLKVARGFPIPPPCEVANRHQEKGCVGCMRLEAQG